MFLLLEWIISNQNNNKRSSRDVQTKFGKKVGDLNASDPIARLRRWAHKAVTGEYGSYRRINVFVFSKFCEARDRHQVVHDIDIKRWALDYKDKIAPQLKFVASAAWITLFKKRYRIVSRSITHKVSTFILLLKFNFF